MFIESIPFSSFSRQIFLSLSSGSLSLKQYGHLLSIVPLPQQSHIIIASGDAPMYGLSWLINSPASLMDTLLCADIFSLYVFKAFVQTAPLIYNSYIITLIQYLSYLVHGFVLATAFEIGSSNSSFMMGLPQLTLSLLPCRLLQQHYLLQGYLKSVFKNIIRFNKICNLQVTCNLLTSAKKG